MKNEYQMLGKCDCCGFVGEVVQFKLLANFVVTEDLVDHTHTHHTHTHHEIEICIGCLQKHLIKTL